MSATQTEPTTAPDLYAPWREPIARLRERHVGRAHELEAILAAARAFLAGQRPLPVYLFGPRGVGKSHVLAVAGEALRADLDRVGAALVVVPEDIPELRAAEQLVERMQIVADGQRWTRWSTPARAPLSEGVPARRRLVFIEGFDRQLRALGLQGRRELRRLLAAQDLWWLGTGVSLTDELTRTDEAFHGAVDAWPIDALPAEEAARLLDLAAGVGGLQEPAWWPPRREALKVLGGGNARALVALGIACAQAPERWASDQLHAVIHAFTAHYQMRFRDLSPQGQQVVELLALAPRELTPTEIGTHLGLPASQVSVVAGRLVADGVLRQRAAGRQSWFWLGEPLFRYWLEYRNAKWDHTRAAWLSRLLEALLQPAELAAAWWESPDEAVRAAAARVIEQSGAAQKAAWDKLVQQLNEQILGAADTAAIQRIAKRAAELPVDAFWTRAIVSDLLWLGHGELARQELVPQSKRSRATWWDLHALLDLEKALRGAEGSPRAAFVTALGSLSRAPLADLAVTWALRGTRSWLPRLLDKGVEPRGAPWVLRPHERRQLAAVPFLRAMFLLRGRRFSHPPLLEPPDVLAVLGATPDAKELLVAASSLRSDELLRAAAACLEKAERGELPICPHPSMPASAPEVIAQLVLRHLASHRPPWSAVSWAATFAGVSPETFEQLREALGAARSTAQPSSLPRPDLIVLALAALGRQSQERFDQLVTVLPDSARGAIDRARLLVEQLAEGEQGRLHPELEQLRLRLAPKPGG